MGSYRAAGQPKIYKLQKFHLILYVETELRVSVPEKAPVVDVRRATDDHPVVGDHQLGVDVDQLRGRDTGQLVVGPEGEEAEVAGPVGDAGSYQARHQGQRATAEGPEHAVTSI